jgi:hypothetical protein
MSEVRYVHEDKFHQDDASPKLMVPILNEIFQPKSVVEKILGVDGTWADQSKIDKNIALENFLTVNLEDIFNPDSRFDLAISLEVAEHIDEKYADNFVKTLTNCSDNIVFSAAIPLQGGQNHVNEQWNDYWIEKFSKHGYFCLDVIKPFFWDTKEIFRWYKQNVLFFTNNPESINFESKNVLQNVIHPEMFSRKTQELNEFKEKYEAFLDGDLPLKDYFKILTKKVLKKIK